MNESDSANNPRFSRSVSVGRAESVSPMASAHDHTACIERALKEADLLCANADVRLTELRRKVLELIWQSHAPLGAYRLMEMLEQASDRKRVAPPTVYRALDFLIEQKLIHKVHSLNAFIGCTRPRQPHGDALFICRECGFTEEVASKPIQQAINLSASQQRFEVEDQFMEIIGRCAACRAKQKSGASQEELL